ncbi:MAG: hypothetical protein HRT66_09595 [Flavobacteriaceae bacterium]|nr:hypothetical protein [Flavobacteriaceae bacterium]
MPRKRQFGFVFSSGGYEHTLAHELGHGMFGLEHSDNKDLLMYGEADGGENFTHMDWDKMHAAGFKLYLFDSDDDGELNTIVDTDPEEDLWIHFKETEREIKMYILTSLNNLFTFNFDDSKDSQLVEENKKEYKLPEILKEIREKEELSLEKGTYLFGKEIEVESTKLNGIILEVKEKLDGKLDDANWKVSQYKSRTTNYSETANVHLYDKVEYVVDEKVYIIFKVTADKGEFFKEYLLGEEKAKVPITSKLLTDVFTGLDEAKAKEIADAINKYSGKYEINTPERMKHFLAQIGHETGGMKKLKENHNYDEKAIYTVFVKVRRTMTSTKKTYKYIDLIDGYDGVTDSCPSSYQGPKMTEIYPSYDYIWSKSHAENIRRAENYKAWKKKTKLAVKSSYTNSKSLFDYVYSCRLGNGAKSTKDGSLYLGKGFIHITGKEKYTRIYNNWKEETGSKKTITQFMDLLENDIDVAMQASMIEWNTEKDRGGVMKSGNDFADDGDIDEITWFVNGGTNGGGKREELKTKIDKKWID